MTAEGFETSFPTENQTPRAPETILEDQVVGVLMQWAEGEKDSASALDKITTLEDGRDRRDLDPNVLEDRRVYDLVFAGGILDNLVQASKSGDFFIVLETNGSPLPNAVCTKTHWGDKKLYHKGESLAINPGRRLALTESMIGIDSKGEPKAYFGTARIKISTANIARGLISGTQLRVERS